MYFVYELLDQETPFYVGLTTDPERRIYDHVYAWNKTKKKGVYLQNMFSLGRKPTLRIIEEVEEKALGQQRETYWIETYTEQGIALTNIVHVEAKKQTPKPKKEKRVKQVRKPRMRKMLIQEVPPPPVKPLFYQWLKFNVLDELWKIFLGKNDPDLLLQEEMLTLVNQFVEEIQTKRELREKEKRHLEIWHSCFVWQLTHPDVGPAFSG